MQVQASTRHSTAVKSEVYPITKLTQWVHTAESLLEQPPGSGAASDVHQARLLEELAFVKILIDLQSLDPQHSAGHPSSARSVMTRSVTTCKASTLNPKP